MGGPALTGPALTGPELTGPELTGGGFDRAAHRRRDEAWLAEAWSRAGVIPIEAGRALVRDAGAADAGSAEAGSVDAGSAGKPELVLLGPADVPADAERYFLGVGDDGTPYFAVATALPAVTGTRGATLRDVGEVLPEVEAALLVSAIALVNWHAQHGYSPSSGRPTTVGEAGWTRVTDDGETLWPRTDPAVIVLVHDGVPGATGRCLLAQNAAWRGMAGNLPRYSCLAGFVEPGESAEQTVVREIAEEVGVLVRDVRYVSSQPWPFPRSLMLGFTALADPDAQPRADEEEIADARWFTRAEVAAALAGEAVGFGLPMALSIAHYLISSWAAPTPRPRRSREDAQ